LRVLIAHAHPIEVLGLTDILHTLEYALVGSVTSGQEAILAAAEHQPDLMLVDGDLRGGFQNWRARRFATRKMHALCSSDWMMNPSRS